MTFISTGIHWAYPLIGTSFYVWTLFHFAPDGNKRSMTPNAKNLVVLHNILLALFSFYVFIQMSVILFSELNTLGWRGFFQSSFFGDQWSLIDWYGWIFYLSKYYEFIDTWILMTRGIKPGILQTFHHTGAVWATWAFHVARSPAYWIFLSFNSLVHTLMYTYYGLTALGHRPKWKILMTVGQISQFILGLSVSVAYFLYETPMNGKQALATAFNQSYVSLVLYLFCDFFISTYLQKKKKIKPSSSSSLFLSKTKTTTNAAATTITKIKDKIKNNKYIRNKDEEEKKEN